MANPRAGNAGDSTIPKPREIGSSQLHSLPPPTPTTTPSISTSTFPLCPHLGLDRTGPSWKGLPAGTQPSRGALSSLKSCVHPSVGPTATPSSVGSWKGLNSRAVEKNQVSVHVGGPQRGLQRPTVPAMQPGGISGPKLNSFIWSSLSATSWRMWGIKGQSEQSQGHTP